MRFVSVRSWVRSPQGASFAITAFHAHEVFAPTCASQHVAPNAIRIPVVPLRLRLGPAHCGRLLRAAVGSDFEVAPPPMYAMALSEEHNVSIGRQLALIAKSTRVQIASRSCRLDVLDNSSDRSSARPLGRNGEPTARRSTHRREKSGRFSYTDARTATVNTI